MVDSRAGVVERFLEAMVTHDWDAMSACLAPDVERIGPFGDSYHGRNEYVEFISHLMPSLPGYSMDIARVVYAAQQVALVELSETMEVDGAPVLTPEGLIFDLDQDGLIHHISIYIRRLQPTPIPSP